MQLGERRVLHPGRWWWLRAMAWLVLVFFLTAAAFGLPLQAAVDLLPPDNGAIQFAALVVAGTAALGSYALAVRLGEGRWAAEIAVRPALPGVAVGALLGLAMMALLMGVLVATGAYDITVIGATPAWTGLGLALQAAVTEEAPCTSPTQEPHRSPVHRGHGRTDVLRALRPDRAALGPDRVTPHLDLAQGYLFGAVVSGNNLGGSILLSHAHPGAPAWLTGGRVCRPQRPSGYLPWRATSHRDFRSDWAEQ